MPKVSHIIYNKYDEQFIIMQYTVECNNKEMKTNKRDSNEKMMKLIKDFKKIIASITDHINTLKSSTTQKDSPKLPDPTTAVPANMRYTPF